MNYTILNSKARKEVLKLITEQWGIDDLPDYVFLKKKDGKIYIVNREVELVIDKKIRIDTLGLYFAEVRDDIEEIRLSIEGSMILGKIAKKNVVEIGDDDARLWLKGQDIEYDGQQFTGFAIIKHNNDFLGSGKYSKGKIFNFVPKSRRIMAVD